MYLVVLQPQLSLEKSGCMIVSTDYKANSSSSLNTCLSADGAAMYTRADWFIFTASALAVCISLEEKSPQSLYVVSSLAQITAGEPPVSLKSLFTKWLLNHFFCTKWKSCQSLAHIVQADRPGQHTATAQGLLWDPAGILHVNSQYRMYLEKSQVQLLLETLSAGRADVPELSVSCSKMGSVIITRENYKGPIYKRCFFHHGNFAIIFNLRVWIQSTFQQGQQNKLNFLPKFHFYLLTICCKLAGCAMHVIIILFF